MDEIELQIALFLAEHPRLITLAGLALLLVNTVNARTSRVSPVEMARLEEDAPRRAGLLWITRGLGQMAAWVLRGFLLVVAPHRVTDRGTVDGVPWQQFPPSGRAQDSAPPTPRTAGDGP
jgi:hypothetical protein